MILSESRSRHWAISFQKEIAYSVTITAAVQVYICGKDLLLLLPLVLSDVGYIDQIDPCVILIYLLYIYFRDHMHSYQYNL